MKKQRNLENNILQFNSRARSHVKVDKEQKGRAIKKANTVDVRELVLSAFKSGIFLLKSAQGKGIKILTPKQLFQRLPISLA